ncbi:MAG TPA: UvrD-helicase domain-containing protein [Solirubrobacterales bacterium]|nr:UvrD-helicase domain-containing protein [Solirubrobacterales bacterium]
MLQTEPESAGGDFGAPTEAGADRAERLLGGLNEPQREAVRHGEGPLLVLAGAGSGKTRVLTHRIAYLLATGQARPGEILAITFTNKAANEMRERVEALVGRSARAMWVTTFHSACARMLRADAERLGYSRGFTIYDESDSLRMLKRCMEELHVDPKRYPPRAIRAQISGAKNQLVDADAYSQAAGSIFEETAAGVFHRYEKRMLEANAMDFDDLLVRTVNGLELFEEVRERWRRTFRHVLVDEYQDTNHAQYRLLQLLTSEHGNLMVVGDEDQCLVEGTLVTMADGSEKPIEKVEAGDRVLSCYGSGIFRSSKVSASFRSEHSCGVKITTASGREIVSTPQHVHFAGYRSGFTPDMYMTYAMHRRGVGFRVGMTRTSTDRRGKSLGGIHHRAMQQRADAAWVVSTHRSEDEARVAEAILAARHGLPTLPFMASSARSGVMSNQGLIDQVFKSVDSSSSGLRLLEKEGLDRDAPHHCWQGFEGSHRNLVLTLCADRSGKHALHTLSLGGRNRNAAKKLEDLGFRVTNRPKAKGWRSERYFKTYKEALGTAEKVKSILGGSIRRVARFGKREKGRISSLPFIPASSIRPGMAMFAKDGSYDTVTDVECVVLSRPVFDLNVESTHNFIANGLITHNSIYGFRGADIRNVLDFEKDFPEAEIVKLEQNYRSTQTILSAANAVVENNRERRPKRLWTELAGGEPLQLRELSDEHEEARWVAGEIERLGEDEGVKREDVAVFYRTNAMSRVLEDTLNRFDVPYQVIGGTKFYERAEVKDAIAYLSLLANPADQVSFARIVNSPRRGIGKTSQGRLIARANTTGLPIWEVIERVEEVPGLSGAAIKAIPRFYETVAGLRERADEEGPVAGLLEAVLTESGYSEALAAERTVEAEGRIENLEALVEGAAEFDVEREREGESEVPPLDEYLQQISLYTQQDDLRDESVITLMTLHNAKGLEYETVFVVGCEDGSFPHMKALEEGSEEEERRLCYVAITRARSRLYMTWTRERRLFGRAERNLPSRFVDELPEELVERGSSAVGTAGRWAGPTSGEAASPVDPGPMLELRTGDDVVHASFGDGVVTAVEPGGVVVVRFAGDGSERKLMADYAPIRRR